MFPTDVFEGSTPFPSGPSAHAPTHDAFSPLPQASPGFSFKLNPRAPPFLKGAHVHPPTPISAFSPTESEMSPVSIMFPVTPTFNWPDLSAHVPATGCFGPNVLDHDYLGPQGYGYYPQEPPDDYDGHFRSNTITQAMYDADTYNHAGHGYVGYYRANDFEVRQAEPLANYNEAYFPMGGPPWSNNMYGYGYGYGYGYDQPDHVSAHEPAGWHGGWDSNQFGWGKRGKKNGKKMGKRTKVKNRDKFR